MLSFIETGWVLQGTAIVTKMIEDDRKWSCMYVLLHFEFSIHSNVLSKVSINFPFELLYRKGLTKPNLKNLRKLQNLSFNCWVFSCSESLSRCLYLKKLLILQIKFWVWKRDNSVANRNSFIHAPHFHIWNLKNLMINC